MSQLKQFAHMTGSVSLFERGAVGKGRKEHKAKVRSPVNSILFALTIKTFISGFRDMARNMIEYMI